MACSPTKLGANGAFWNSLEHVGINGAALASSRGSPEQTVAGGNEGGAAALEHGLPARLLQWLEPDVARTGSAFRAFLATISDQ